MSKDQNLLNIVLKRINKTYKEGESVAGFVVIESKNEVSHQGLTLTLDGNVNMQLSAKNVGVFEAFYNSVKPIQLVAEQLELAKAGRFPAGKTEIAFEIPLRAKPNRTLFETYHGVFIMVQYALKAELRRGMLNRDAERTCEFVIEYRDGERAVSKPFDFVMNSESVQNVKNKRIIPRFKLTGRIDSLCCRISDPLSGELVVEHCEAPIKSIELQLLRVETCGCAEGYSKDSTEIQNLQIADGDVFRGVRIPIWMVFPRLFACPTLATPNFKIEFELNIVVIFRDDHLVTETFPLKLTRF